jgi:hypothetical protein
MVSSSILKLAHITETPCGSVSLRPAAKAPPRLWMGSQATMVKMPGRKRSSAKTSKTRPLRSCPLSERSNSRIEVVADMRHDS